MSDDNSGRGLANADEATRKRVASSSPTKFKPGDPRAREAGQKGGQARANDPDVKSGELGRQGAAARWGNDDDEESTQ